MNNLLINLINLYQRYLSLDHSPQGKMRYPYGYCRFSPSCSQYAKETLASHNIFRAAGKILYRVLRCNPFTTPSFDPVNKKT